MLKRKSILKLIFVIVASLLLTSCQNGSNIEQSSTSSESAQSSSSPEEEVTLFGKPLNEIDWNPAISKNYETMFTANGGAMEKCELNSHETAVFLRNIILAYNTHFHTASYPAAVQETDQFVTMWVYLAIYRIHDGFHGKTWADYPYRGKPFPDGFVPEYSIPVGDIADCLTTLFEYPGDNILEKLRLSYQYRPETDTIDEPQYGIGHNDMAVISIDNVTRVNTNTLQLNYTAWDYLSFADTNSNLSYEAFLQKAEKNYTMEMTVRITSDEDAKWQIISCENKNK